eukprot:TRINITY_DN9208_c0_g1_i1.p1 TRINITY_DN9208_c0_g1~~TRINITY_DN9208_c0_g1_i1.p1  ORF type:complete len:286 (+),score=72.37 TRINITY_DN9208_c0_g1_i1:70-858(+)
MSATHTYLLLLLLLSLYLSHLAVGQSFAPIARAPGYLGKRVMERDYTYAWFQHLEKEYEDVVEHPYFGDVPSLGVQLLRITEGEEGGSSPVPGDTVTIMFDAWRMGHYQDIGKPFIDMGQKLHLARTYYLDDLFEGLQWTLRSMIEDERVHTFIQPLHAYKQVMCYMEKFDPLVGGQGLIMDVTLVGINLPGEVPIEKGKRAFPFGLHTWPEQTEEEIARIKRGRFSKEYHERMRKVYPDEIANDREAQVKYIEELQKRGEL